MKQVEQVEQVVWMKQEKQVEQVVWMKQEKQRWQTAIAGLPILQKTGAFS